MSQLEAKLNALEGRFQTDGIAYLLIQFVDIHGAAKVKLIQAKALRSAAQAGAEFAGGAVWDTGQGPHSHDMCARIDLETYTPLRYEPGVARFAADLYVDASPRPYCPRVNLRQIHARARELGFVFNVGIEPEFFLVTQQADGQRLQAAPGRPRPDRFALRLHLDPGLHLLRRQQPTPEDSRLRTGPSRRQNDLKRLQPVPGHRRLPRRRAQRHRPATQPGRAEPR